MVKENIVVVPNVENSSRKRDGAAPGADKSIAKSPIAEKAVKTAREQKSI
jgi:hypothetical protein